MSSLQSIARLIKDQIKFTLDMFGMRWKFSLKRALEPFTERVSQLRRNAFWNAEIKRDDSGDSI